MKAVIAVCLLALLVACSNYTTAPKPMEPPPETQTISVVFCDVYTPLWVAFQDGDGAWTHVQPVSANGNRTYQYTFTSSRGGVATVLEATPGTTYLQVFYGTPAEIPSVGLNRSKFCETTGDKTLNGTVAGIADAEEAIIRGGFASTTVIHGVGDFELDHVPAGPRDFLAARVTSDNGTSLVLTKLLLLRGVDVPDNASLPLLDFDAAAAFAPVVRNVTLTGDGVDGAFLATSLRTSNFENQFSIPIAGVPGPTQPYYALPEAQLAAGDLQELIATTHGATPGSSRSVLQYFRSPVDRTVEFGPDVIGPSVTTVATTPALRLRAQFVQQDAYDREASVYHSADGPGSVAVLMTAAYASLQSGYDLVIPELSGVGGFDPAWALHAVASVRWTANRLGGTLGLGIDPVPTDGAIRRAATATDIITP